MENPVVRQWERDRTSLLRRSLRWAWGVVQGPVRVGFVAGAGALLGLQLAAGSHQATPKEAELYARLRTAEASMHARHGELELLRIEIRRLTRIMEFSRRYAIPADLARSIHDIALAEGVDPDLAYRLVRVESGFMPYAVSPMGAVGLAQVMPRTAYELDPTLGYRDLFDRETNLHLGFRYLRLMLERYDGDLQLALLAYNRGPGTVDMVLREGGDPENGYSLAVLGGL